MDTRNNRIFAAIAALLAGAATIGSADAQPYPAKPIRAIIPAAPGSNNDIFFRMLAQTGKVRSATVPDIPTMQEAGLPGFYVNTGFGFAGPGGMPRPIVERLNSALAKAVQEPANRKSLLDQGADPVGGTPEEHHAFIKSEVARWEKVTKEAGITPE